MGPVDLPAPIPARGISSTGPTGAAGAVVRIGLGQLGQSPGLEPLILRVGQRLLADVLAADVVTGRAVLSIAGRRVVTQLPATQPAIRQGDVIRLAVAEALPDRVTLRLEDGTTRTARAAQLDAAGVLAQLDLPDTPPLRAALTALVERALPLHREAVLAVRNAAIATPAPVSDSAPEAFLLDAARAAVRLRQDGVPLTPRSLQLGHATIAGPFALPLGTLLGDLLRLIDAELPLSDGPDAPSALASAGDVGDDAAGASLAGAPMPSVAPRFATRLPTALAAELPQVDTDAADGASGTPDDAGPVLASRSLPAEARAALVRLIATPTAATLQRAIEALLQAPEAQLASVIVEGEVALPQMQRSPRPDPGPRTILSNLAAASAEPLGLSTRVPLAPSGLTGSPLPTALSPAQGDPELPSLPRPLALASGDGGRSEDGPAEGIPDTRSATLARAVGALAAALHDRIELQQLRAAASLAQQAEASPSQPLPPGTAIPPPSTELIDGAALLLRAPDGGPPGGSPGNPPGMPLVLSLPFALGGQLTTLDLTVQPDRDHRAAGGAASPAIRASFSVHLERLGTVGADVRLTGASLRCRLHAESETALDAMAGAAKSLRARLQHVGFTVEALDCTLADATFATTPTVLHHVSVDA